MRIGTTSMVFWRRDLSEGIREAAELGFHAIELWVSHLEKESDLSLDVLVRLLDEAGLARTLHAAIRDINIASANAGIRRESTSQMVDAVGIAAAIGAELVVVHPGRLSSRHSDPEKHWAYQVDAYRQVLKAATDRRVTVTTENMEWEKKDELVRTVADIRRLQVMLSEFRLPVTLDLTHLGTTERVLDAIEQLGDDVVHVHVSDCGPPMHIALGRGTLDLPRIVRELDRSGFRGILSLEVFLPVGEEAALRAEKEKLAAMLPSA